MTNDELLIEEGSDVVRREPYFKQRKQTQKKFKPHQYQTVMMRLETIHPSLDCEIGCIVCGNANPTSKSGVGQILG